MTALRAAIGVPLAILLVTSGCGGDRNSGEMSPPGDRPPQSQLAYILPGSWRGICATGPGGTSRRTDYRFGKGDSKLEIVSTTFQGPACAPPALLTYRYTGTYRPVPYSGEVGEAYLTILREDLLKEANRTPSLYEFTDWRLANETPLRGKLTPDNFRSLSEAVFPKDGGALFEGGKLYLAEDVKTKAEPFTRGDTAAR